jgi:transposase
MNRRYDKAFRDQAMKLVVNEGRDPTGVARDLGMPTSTLFKWLRDSGWTPPADKDRAVPLPDDVAVLKARVVDLERQVKDLETDREILKKATAFFANQNK